MKLIFKSQAIGELESAYTYYQSINPELADRFETEVWKYLDAIESFEKIFQIRYRVVRIGPLKKFPYSIHYYLEDDRIVVIGIKHQRQFYK